MRRLRSGFHHWLSVKSYTPDRPSPKSSVAIVVPNGSGAADPDHPAGDNGLARGASKRDARTVTGSKPAPSMSRIIEVAWYRWVEDTCTEVACPMTPSRSRVRRAA